MVDINEKIEQGWIKLTFITEVQGNDAKLVKQALAQIVDRLKKDKVIVLKKHLSKPDEIGKSWYSVFAEIGVLVYGFEGLINLAMKYAPSSVEIEAPDKITVSARELQSSMVGISTMVTTLAQTAHLARLKTRKMLPKELEEDGGKDS
jgi:chromatin segregation and condensation protein Rec8/ScpA/Scc1 (kleisin family)